MGASSVQVRTSLNELLVLSKTQINLVHFMAAYKCRIALLELMHLIFIKVLISPGKKCLKSARVKYKMTGFEGKSNLHCHF